RRAPLSAHTAPGRVSVPPAARLVRRHPRPDAAPRTRVPHRRGVGRPAPPRRIRRRRDGTGHPPTSRAPTPLLPRRNRGPPSGPLIFESACRPEAPQPPWTAAASAVRGSCPNLTPVPTHWRIDGVRPAAEDRASAREAGKEVCHALP